MLRFRVFGEEDRVRSLGEELEREGVLRAATVSGGLTGSSARLEAQVSAEDVDLTLERVRALGIPEADVSVTREETLGGAVRPPSTSLIWSDMLGQAVLNAHILGRYIAFMTVAGVVAGFGVIYDNGILIVGAMAISPDMLPIVAICVGLVAHDRALAGRALATLLAGFLATCLSGAAIAAIMSPLGLLPGGFEVGASSLSGLTSVNVATIGVALAAGVAAILALETRASSGVGVAISVTTIPAAAYLGVAASVGDADTVLGAIAVLGVNVCMISIAGVSTLLTQRRLSRAGARGDGDGRTGPGEGRNGS